MLLALSKLSVINSKGFIRHIAIVTANGHSELDLQAYSTGAISPSTNGPLLLIKEKSCASAESNGLNSLPSASTGI